MNVGTYLKELYTDRSRTSTLRILNHLKKRGHNTFVIFPSDVTEQGVAIREFDGVDEPFNEQFPAYKSWKKQFPKRAERDQARIEYSRNRFDEASNVNLDVILMRKNSKDQTLDTLNSVAGLAPYTFNSPEAVMLDKSFLVQDVFAPYTPETFLPVSFQDAQDYVNENGIAIIKPVDGSQGTDVSLVSKRKDFEQEFYRIRNNSSKGVMVQQYDERAKDGDKRILVVGNEIVGGFIRKPQKGEYRSNIAKGATAIQTDITTEERDLIYKVLPHFQQMGAFAIGFDILGYNTSQPTLLEANTGAPGFKGLQNVQPALDAYVNLVENADTIYHAKKVS